MQLSTELKTHKILFKYDPGRSTKFILVGKNNKEAIQRAFTLYNGKERINGGVTIGNEESFLASDIKAIEKIDLNAQIMISEQRNEVLQHCVPVDSDAPFRAQFYNIDVKDVKSREIIQGHELVTDVVDCQCRTCITSIIKGYRGMISFCEDCGCFSPWTLSPKGDLIQKDGEDWQPTEVSTICLYCN